jgi:hypothetical protein
MVVGPTGTGADGGSFVGVGFVFAGDGVAFIVGVLTGAHESSRWKPASASFMRQRMKAHLGAPAVDLHLAGWFPRPNHEPHHRPLLDRSCFAPPPSRKVVEAWKKAGAQVGWHGQNKSMRRDTCSSKNAAPLLAAL